MKLRNAAAAFGLAATIPLAACHGGDTSPKQPTSSPAILRFLANAGDSDYAAGINCEENGDTLTSLSLSSLSKWLGKKVDVVTLGDAEQLYDQETNPFVADPRMTFLAGATIRYTGPHMFNIVTSDDPKVKEVDLTKQDFSAEIPVAGKDFGVAIKLEHSYDDTFTVSCVMPNAVPHPSLPQSTSPQSRV